jgi:hypothetical protein
MVHSGGQLIQTRTTSWHSFIRQNSCEYFKLNLRRVKFFCIAESPAGSGAPLCVKHVVGDKLREYILTLCRGILLAFPANGSLCCGQASYRNPVG